MPAVPLSSQAYARLTAEPLAVASLSLSTHTLFLIQLSARRIMSIFSKYQTALFKVKYVLPPVTFRVQKNRE